MNIETGPRLHAGLTKVVVCGLLVIAFAARVYLTRIPGYEGDTTHFKWWIKLVTQQGLAHAYSGTYPETYVLYPPLMLAGFGVIGQLYRHVVSPAINLDDPRLGYMIKGFGIVFDLLTWMVIFAWVRKRRGMVAASLVTAAYACCPAVIFDVAYWGLLDAIFVFFLLVSVLWLVDRRPSWAWAALAAAAFAKPQVWPLIPLAAFATILGVGVTGLARGAAAAAGVCLALVAPFLFHHTFSELMTLPRAFVGYSPVLSANAHNIWWLYTPNADVVRDDGRLWLLSSSTWGLLLASAGYALALWRLRRRGAGELPAAAAFVAFCLFMLRTRVHENHGFMVLALLAVSMAQDPALRWIFGVLSLTFTANMALHDPLLADRLWTEAALPYWQPLQVLNAAVNTAVLTIWTVVLARGPRRSAS